MALAALLAGLAILAYGSVRGDVRFGFLLFIPFVYGTGLLPALGMLLVMAAAFLWLLGAASRRMPAAASDDLHDLPAEAAARENRLRGAEAGRADGSAASSRHGGVVLLGPIPIVWGSDRRILPWMIALGAAMLVLAAMVYFGARAR